MKGIGTMIKIGRNIELEHEQENKIEKNKTKLETFKHKIYRIVHVLNL